MIEAKGISKRFGSVVAVRDLSLRVDAGQVVALVGQNGAGKTTTLRLLAGFFEPDTGAVTVAGHDLSSERRQAMRALGYVAESAPIPPDMRVVEYLRFRARLKGVAPTGVAAAVDEALLRTDTADRASWLVGTLSRGQRQRVALADALVADPQALILDEPTSGLDPVQVRRFIDLLAELSSERAVIIASHVLGVLEQVADEFAVMAAGSVLARGSGDDLRRRAGVEQGAAIEDAFVALVTEGAP